MNIGNGRRYKSIGKEIDQKKRKKRTEGKRKERREDRRV
jgi:hypothetical protein